VADPSRVETPRPARGRRPQYFDDPAIDQLHATLLAVTAELSVLHDRFDLIERVLETKGVVTREDIEGFALDDQARTERGEDREQLIRRLFRSVSELREKLEQD
jgi:hypothetical protein